MYSIYNDQTYVLVGLQKVSQTSYSQVELNGRVDLKYIEVL